MIKQLITQEVLHMPEKLEQGIIYVSEEFKLAIHLCACGCRVETVTPFDSDKGWQLTRDPEGITLQPSIGNMNFACKSHYFVTNGKVLEC